MYNFFCHTPDLRPPPIQPASKFCWLGFLGLGLGLASRVRIIVRVLASGHPQGRGAQRLTLALTCNPRNPSQQNFDAGWIGGGRKSGVWQKKINMVF